MVSSEVKKLKETVKQQAERIERLEDFIKLLQKGMGWQIDIEKIPFDNREYDVSLSFSIRFSGRGWHSILRDKDYRETVLEMVKHKLHQVWDAEIETPKPSNGHTADKGKTTREVPSGFRTIFDKG